MEEKIKDSEVKKLLAKKVREEYDTRRNKKSKNSNATL